MIVRSGLPAVLVAAAFAVLLFGCGGPEQKSNAPSGGKTAGESGEPGESVESKQKEHRPNVVMIIVDTLRADKLGCYGFEEDTTPELDALARAGVLFTRPIAQCSWTRPSIASMITSEYPRRLGLYDEQDEILADRFVTLAEVLQANGYNTLGITANPVINSVFNMDQGFDTHFDSDVIFSWMQEDEDQVTARRHRLSSAKELFRTVLDEISADSQGPHYVQINIMEMHEYWRQRYHLTRPEFRRYFRDSPNARYLQALRQVSVDIKGFIEDWCNMSDVPGRSEWDDTLFIINSDHGQGLDDHPDVPHSGAHGRILYESQVVIPLILYHGGGKLGPAKIERPVRLLDIMPTVLDYLDIEGPEAMSGVSLMPLVEDDAAAVGLPENFITETEFRDFEKIAVYADKWKYIENRDGHPRVNPRELQPMGIKENGIRTDRIRQHPEIAERLAKALHEWERAHPKAPPTRGTDDLSVEERRQLQAIGYLD